MRVVALLYAGHAEIRDNLLTVLRAAWPSLVVPDLPSAVGWDTVVVMELDEREFDAAPFFEVRIFAVTGSGEEQLYSDEVMVTHTGSRAPGAPILFRYVLPVSVTILETCVVKIVVVQGGEELAEASFAVLTE